VIITPLLMMQALQIGSKFASEVVEDPKLKNNLSMLSKGLGAGAQLGSLAKAFTSPSTGTGLGIADSKSYEAFKKMPEGIFGGGLKEGATFGEGINKLPESIGGNFKSPSWNAPESIFNFNPGKTKPFDWSLFK
jgi:hypothetical protein